MRGSGKFVGCVAVSMLLVLGLVGNPAWARRPELLPNFRLLDRAGKQVQSRQLQAGERWLLVYLDPRCVPCTALLRDLKAGEFPQVPAARIVVIVRGSRAALEETILDFPDLVPVSWYADPEGAGATALEVTVSPVVLGLQRQKVIWAATGPLRGAARIQTLLATWLQEPVLRGRPRSSNAPASQ